MQQERNFGWAQGKIDALTQTLQEERHEQQRQIGENRAARRKRERQERRAKKMKA
jgi:hypothetical protein